MGCLPSSLRLKSKKKPELSRISMHGSPPLGYYGYGSQDLTTSDSSGDVSSGTNNASVHFSAEDRRHRRMVLVKFYEGECERCDATSPAYHALEHHHPGFLFLECNVRDNPEVVELLGLKVLPTFVAFKDHCEVGRVTTVKIRKVDKFVHQLRSGKKRKKSKKKKKSKSDERTKSEIVELLKAARKPRLKS